VPVSSIALQPPSSTSSRPSFFDLHTSVHPAISPCSSLRTSRSSISCGILGSRDRQRSRSYRCNRCASHGRRQFIRFPVRRDYHRSSATVTDIERCHNNQIPTPRPPIHRTLLLRTLRIDPFQQTMHVKDMRTLAPNYPTISIVHLPKLIHGIA